MSLVSSVYNIHKRRYVIPSFPLRIPTVKSRFEEGKDIVLILSLYNPRELRHTGHCVETPGWFVGSWYVFCAFNFTSNKSTLKFIVNYQQYNN